jgi:hypothetical protein
VVTRLVGGVDHKREAGLDWGRDVSFDEDRSQVRTGSGPHVMASLRNRAISALLLGGYTNIAAAWLDCP